jgi:hypothetical protein
MPGMKIKRLITIVSVGLAAVGIAVFAAPGGAQGSGESTTTFLQKDALDHMVDAPPRGGENAPPSAGDTYYNSNKLLDPSTKRLRGRTHGVCGVTIPGRRAVAFCEFALTLDDGTVVGAGPYPFTSSKVTVPITGGTGEYAGSRGTLTYEDRGTNLALWTIRLAE